MSNKVAPAPEELPSVNASGSMPSDDATPTELPELAGSPQASLFQGNGGSADGAKAEDVAEIRNDMLRDLRTPTEDGGESGGGQYGSKADSSHPRKKSTLDIAWGSVAHLIHEDHPEDSLMDLMTGENVKDPIAKSGSTGSASSMASQAASEGAALKAASAIQTSAFRKFGPALLKLVSPHTDVHEDDEHHEDHEGMDALVLKALRHRRSKHFANKIKGSVMNGKMSNWLIHSYSAPSMSTVPLIALITIWVVQFYEKLGADLAMLAFFQALARGFDVITDPAMSYFTDSFRSSHGRRRPFMMVGCWPYGIAFILLLSPLPSLTTSGIATWFGAFYIIFFLCNTFTNIPYDALAPELTDNQKDRAKLYFVCSVYDGVGMIIAIVLPVALAMAIYPKQYIMDSSSCEVPVDGRISLDSCQMFAGSGRPLDSTFGSTLTSDQQCRTWEMNDTADNFGFNQTKCDVCTIDIERTFSHGELMEYNFCTCMQDCKNVYQNDNQRRAYFAVGMFFGLWYMFTMFNAAKQVKERAQIDGGAALPTPAPMMASLLNTFKNKAFTTLLPAWVCDSLYVQIFLAMLPYYIRYIIEPEFANDECTCGDALQNGAPWYCSSDYILFMSVVALIICALLFMPLWLFAAKRLGKRNAWLLWSFTTAITNTLFAFCGKGDYVSCIVFAGINGIPIGAKFLAEAILADVIDYDEFLTGARSEATYTMFKQFLPKIAAIPASAIPISLLGYYGHISPVDGVIQKQTSVKLVPYLYVVFVAIPSLMALLAFFLKLRFPIKTDEQNDKIAEGVAKHLIGLPADCPISGTPYRLYHMDDKTKNESYKIDNFMGVGIARGLLAKPVEYVRKLKTGMGLQLGAGLLLCALSAMMLGLTFHHFEGDNTDVVWNATTGCPNGNDWMDDDFYNTSSGNKTAVVTEDYSFLPVIAMVLLGISFTVIQWASLRMAAVVDLENNPVSELTLKKVIKQRRLKNKCGDIPMTYCSGFTNESKEHVIPERRRLSAGYDDEDDAVGQEKSNEAPDSQAGVSVL